MAERRVTAATLRARQMMMGGVVLGHVVGFTVIGLALAMGGPGAALTAALGFAAVVVFYGIGQALEVVASEYVVSCPGIPRLVMSAFTTVSAPLT